MILKRIKNWLRRHRKRLSPYVFEEAYIKKQGIEAKADTIQILGLGSSHCARDFNTDLIPNAFNLGTTDQDLYTTEFLFRKYLPNLKNLKKVIFFYGIFSPGHELIKTNSEKTVAIHHYIFDIPYQVPYLSEYQKAFKHRMKKAHKIPPSVSGYLPTDLDVSRHPLNPEVRAKSHLKNNNRETNQTKHLENIYQLCKKAGVVMYVVIAPVRHDYVAALGDETDEHLFRELFAFTNKQHIPILNVMRDSSFTDDEYFDCDHLNRKGALHLTKLVQKFIEK